MRLKVIRMFQDLSEEFGLLDAQRTFEDVLEQYGVEMQHDVLGCRDCQWEGRDVIYCRWSPHHRDHPLHSCPIGQECC